MVNTANGPIIGHPVSYHNGLSEFLGIPYAKPPVESLRFAAPQKYTKKGTFVASRFVSRYGLNRVFRFANAIDRCSRSMFETYPVR